MEINDKFVLSRTYRRQYRISMTWYVCSVLLIVIVKIILPVPLISLHSVVFALLIFSYVFFLLIFTPSEFLLDDMQFTIRYPVRSTIIPLRDIVSVDVIPADFFKGIWWRSFQLRFKGIQGVYFNKDGNTDYYFICNYNERVRILLKWDKSYIISFTDMEFVKQLYKQLGQLQPEDDR